MNQMLRSSVLALGCFALATACGSAPEAVEDSPVEVAPVTGELAPKWTDPYSPDSTACPAAADAVATQKHISAIAKAFMTGVWGNKYMLNNPCTGPNGDAAEINLEMATLTGNFVSGSLWFEDATESATVCGLTAAKKPIKSQDRVISGVTIHTDVHTAIDELAAQLNLCWGVGHRAFLHLGTQIAQRVWIDPEPVRLTQNLSGTAGSATAAGVFVNNPTVNTTAFKWYAEGGSGTVAGGTACSTSNAASNVTLYKSIVVRSSGFRECL